MTGDEDLLHLLKTWEHSCLNKLSICKAIDLLQKNVVNEMTVSELSQLNISLPLTPPVVSCWLKEFNFTYQSYSKSYKVNTHERRDVVEFRKAYIHEEFQNDISECCWMQIPSAMYNTLFPEVVLTEDDDDMEMRNVVRSLAYWYVSETNGKRMWRCMCMCLRTIVNDCPHVMILYSMT